MDVLKCDIYVMRMIFMWWMWDLCDEYEISLKDVKYMWYILFVFRKYKKINKYVVCGDFAEGRGNYSRQSDHLPQ